MAKAKIALIAFILVSIFTAQVSTTIVSAQVTIVDDVRRTITIERPPERIVSIAPSITEILFALGLGDKVVGVTRFCNYPPEVLEKVKKGEITVIGGFTTPELEKIIALNPDIIFGHTLLKPEFISRLEELGKTVIVIKTAESIDGIYEDIELIGKACFVEKAASELISKIKKKISFLEDKLKGVRKVEVAEVAWVKPIRVSGSETYIHDLMERAGGINVFADKKRWVPISDEEFVKRDPPHIICPYRHGEEAIYEGLVRMKEEGLIHGEIHPIDPDIISRPGPRVTIAFEEIIKALHPDVWSRIVEVKELVVPDIATLGEVITAFVKVSNPGEVEGLKIVELEMDGEKVQEEVMLGPGESKLVKFSLPALKAGTFLVRTDGLSSRVEVIPSLTTLISKFKKDIGALRSELESRTKATESRISELTASLGDISYLAKITMIPSIVAIIMSIAAIIISVRRLKTT